MKSLLLITLALITTPIASAQDSHVEYSTLQLSDSVYMLTGRGGNIGVSIGEDGVYVIDDQVKPVAGQLLQALRKLSDQPIRFILNTHYHADHVGGNELLGKTGTLIIAQDNVRNRMMAAQHDSLQQKTIPPYPEIALPVLTFNDSMTLHFNGESVSAYHVAHGHTDGDTIIHFPASNVILMGGMYFNGLYPYVDLDAGGSIEGMVHAADLALSLANDATRIIPGHGPLAMAEDLRTYRDFLIQAIANVQGLIDQGMDLTQIIAARPTAEWDVAQGKTWITPTQFVAFIYYSLEGIHHYTAPVTEAAAE